MQGDGWMIKADWKTCQSPLLLNVPGHVGGQMETAFRLTQDLT